MKGNWFPALLLLLVAVLWVLVFTAGALRP